MADIELNTDTSRLGFLFNKISMPPKSIVTWLTVPEFVDAVNSLVDRRIEVTNDNVFIICQKIMTGKFSDKEIRKQYFYSKIRSGYNHLKRAVESTPNAPQ